MDDKNAIIRNSIDFKSTGKTIPLGTYVNITARSNQTDPKGKYVRVRHLSIENGKAINGESIGWTASSNLVAGNSKVFKTNSWLNIKGDNAAWKRGKFIGTKILVGIVALGIQSSKSRGTSQKRNI